MTASHPTSPTTPSRKRRSLRLSSFDVSQDPSPSPYTSGTTSNTSFSRRSSRTSQTSYQPQSPVTPRPMSSRSSRHSLHRRKSSRASVSSINSIGTLQEPPYEGLGNLADELEQAWEEDVDPEQEQPGSNFLDGLREGDSVASPSDLQSPYQINDMADFGFSHTSIHSPQEQETPKTLHLPASPNRQRRKTNSHNRTESAYDGSDYGSEPDDDLADLPPLLRKRMRDIEKLARDSYDEVAVSEGGGVIKRTISSLRDLGPPQSNIEFGITRLATAYMSMATHRTHKQRELFTLSHSLMYSNASTDLPDEFLDLLVSEIDDLSGTLPFLSPQSPLLSLQILASQTSDLSNTLRSLTDLVQENRLAANVATRKLKSVRDMVDDMKFEEELVDNSIMLIQAGDWDRRCRERQAGRMCGEVVKGFGERWGIEVPVGKVQG